MFLYFGSKMGSRRAGSGLKIFLEAVGFILAEFELKRSHGDPIRDNFYGFLDMRVGAAVSAREISVSARDISVSERETYLCLRFTLSLYIYIKGV